MVLRSSSAGIEHEGFIFDTGATSFPNPMPLFPEGAAGQSWVSAFGTVTLVSKTATVVTPAKTYTKLAIIGSPIGTAHPRAGISARESAIFSSARFPWGSR